MDDQRVVRFGLIGCGRISDRHIQAIQATAKLVAVCDTNKQRLAETAKKHHVKAYTDYKKMLQDQEIDAVSICTPSGYHAEMTIAAAKHKKHVVCEKPMALTLEGADQMTRACKENGVRLYIVKQNRYNPAVRKLKDALDRNRFGRLVIINTTVRWARPQEYYDQDKWRGTKRWDGGVLLNQASHHVDLVRWIGGEVESVKAYTKTRIRKIEVEDTAVAVLHFKNGALGVIEATTCAYPKNMEGSVTVIGEFGSVKIGGTAVNKVEHWEFRNFENDDEYVYRYNTEPPNVYGFGHAEVYKNFVGSLVHNKEHDIDAFEGRKSIEVIQAIYESALTGKTVVMENFLKNR